ncbi:MAG TPA: selenium cofactor biosynthesis protein YqeC [Acidobacteriota bacterium]|nr:selenium cofactor biosynthesis protein YqeC [Acidobacteriota bacterium]
MFAEHFAFQPPALVNFVGAGGKTGLILRLMDEYCQSGTVIYTTTTRIHTPHPHDGMLIVSCQNSALLRLILTRLGQACMNRICKLVITGPSAGPRFLQGVEPGIGRSIDRDLFPSVLNEADGARSMSLKMPREGEPVLMEGANYLVPVIGIDCLMKRLGQETLFRWELAARYFGANEGQPITPGLAADILFHPQGVCKDWKPGMRIVPFINKVDNERLEPLAGELSLALMNNPHFPVERVVWGSLTNCRVASLSAKVQ